MPRSRARLKAPRRRAARNLRKGTYFFVLSQAASTTEALEQFMIGPGVITDHRDHFRLFKLWLLVEAIGRYLQTDINAEVKFVTVER
jgi:hypothetical protein